MDDANIMQTAKNSMSQVDCNQLASVVVKLFPAALGARFGGI